MGLPSGRGRESALLPGAMMAYDDDRTWPLVVVLEGHSADVNLRMEPTTACRVKLVGPDDRPVAGAKVMFSPNQAWHRGGSQVLGDGDSQSLLLRTTRLNQSEEKGSDQGEQLQDAGRRYEAISDANGVANVRNLPSHGSATFYVRHPTLQLPLSEENPSHRFVTVDLASDKIAEVTVKLQRKEAPANADLSVRSVVPSTTESHANQDTEETTQYTQEMGQFHVLSAVPSETEIRNAIIGKWKLKSAERRGDRLQVDASDLQPYSLIEFDADHVSFGKASAQATLERWSYRLDLDSDPMRLELSRSGVTRKAICWYVYDSDSPLVGQLSIVLPEEGDDFPEGFDTNGNDNLKLDYQRDETDPDWLEAEASRFRKNAVDFLLHGNAGQQEFARELQEWAAFYLREASLRRKAQATAATANELRVAGKLQQAKLVQRDADELRSQADAEHAKWEVSVQLRDLEKQRQDWINEKQRQDWIKMLTAKTANLRDDGRFDEAREVERELQQLLRDQNRSRANELKRRAAESRAKGDHRDADLYDREAERLLLAVDQQDVAGGGAEGELLPATTNEKEDAGAGGPMPASASAGGDSAEDDQADKFRVQGRVTDLSGNPLTDVELKVYTGYGTLSQTGRGITDANGRYDFIFTPGFSSATIVPQAATITAHKAGYFELNLNRQGNRLMAGVMPTKDNKSFAGVFLPGKTERIDFVMALAGQIEGLLVDHAGRPVPNRRLSLTGINLPPSSSVFQSTETDKNGRFHFSDVPGSPYKWWFEMRISGEGRSRVQLRTEPLQVDGGTLITVLLEYAAGSDAEPPSLECKGQRKELTTDHLIN